MRMRTLAVALLVLASLPLVAGQVPAADGSPSTASDRSTAVASGGGASGTSGSGTGGTANYTRLYVDAERTYRDLKPGGRVTMNVTVENGEDGPVTVRPRIYAPSLGERPLNMSWVDLSTTEAVTLAAGAERTFTVTVTVPEDAEVGNYDAQVAFTNETVTYPGRPPRPVHAQHVGVDVWKEPTVTVEGGYGRLQVEAGETVSHEIVVENSGDSPVPLNPQLSNRGRTCHGDCPETLDRSWLDIDAPAEVRAGEEATVTVTVSPPADADQGRYDVELDLGLKDPARDERDTYWQRLNLNVEVWSQPSEPFETEFSVSERTENVTLTLTPRSSGYRQAGGETADRADFDVTFVGPDGTTVDAERVRVSERGFVDLSGDDRRAVRTDGEYAVRGGETRFVYRLDEPTAGTWSVRITPENTIGFGYELTRTEN